LEVFSTCCPSNTGERHSYLERVAQVARWSEQAGCKGILVYTDNSLVDPWLVAQIILQSTDALCPLVALQPVYLHPYAAAKMVTSLAYLHGRRVYLNMVAGGFKNDLAALCDGTPHDRRYARLEEYTLLIKRLLEGSSPVTLAGEFYQVDKLVLKPALPPELFPGIFVSGSSEAGCAAARAIGAVAVKYPEPAPQCSPASPERAAGCGLRVGIIARQQEDQAWETAYRRFPEDRRGQVTHQLAMKVSDSQWHHQLSRIGEEQSGGRDTYWLGPFQNYKTFCPYLVGSYETVSAYLGRYIGAGYRTFILDIPADEEELHHAGVVFGMASQGVA
jgi:alkanesulfonate monooxygenase